MTYEIKYVPSSMAVFAAVLAQIACTSSPQRLASPEKAASAGTSEEIVGVLRAYEAALNASDVNTIVGLYATDGVFMAQHRPPAEGRDAITSAYDHVFEMITLNITFDIDEVVIASPRLAYARTRSAGTTTINASGQSLSEGNQELFILARAAPSAPWKISRYIFSTTQPRPAQ